MSLLLLFQSAAASGAGTAFPAGVQMTLAIGQVVATGSGVVPVPVVAGIGGGGGGGSSFVARRTVAKQQWTRAAEADPDGVEIVAAVGQVYASGGATVAVRGVMLKTAVGQVEATGIQNLSDEALILVLDEAA